MPGRRQNTFDEIGAGSALQQHFFPGSARQCAFMNSASRLIHGRALHSAFKLPRKGWTASSRTLGHDKEMLLSSWKNVQTLLIDEISMVPADLFADTELRAKQVKNSSEQLWRNLTLLLSGDPMQLPPVAAPSLFGPLLPAEAPDVEESPVEQQKRLAAARGQTLWRNICSCIILEVSHRSSGPLQTLP